MKVLFATDLHGRPGHFRQLLDQAQRLHPDVLILGGDVLPDADPTDPLGSQAEFVTHQMREYLQQIRRTCPRTQTATIFGNHDWLCTYEATKVVEAQDLIRIIRSDKPVVIGPFEWYGYWCAPPCPYLAKDFERLDLPGQTYPFDGGAIWDRRHQRVVQVDAGALLRVMPSIQEELRAMPVPETDNWILVAHPPPLGTALDILTGYRHVGSQAVKEFILQRQPLLSLHGHIHESPRLSGRYYEWLGHTVAINPGQRDDRLAAVLADLTDESLILTPLHVESAQPVAQRLPWPAVRRLA